MKYSLLSIILLSILAAGCEPAKPILSFDECVAAGNPVMESYPRQCRAGDRTFMEDVTPQEIARYIRAHGIAASRTSECSKAGNVLESAFYNENTKTWWFGMDIEKEGCSPACVVSEETFTAEINWRCTGAHG